MLFNLLKWFAKLKHLYVNLVYSAIRQFTYREFHSKNSYSYGFKTEMKLHFTYYFT